MKRAVLVVALMAAAAAAGAQIPNTMEGEAIVGLAAQHDYKQFDGVRLSPVGLNIGFIVQPVFGRRRMSIVEQLSFFPVVFYERAGLTPLGRQTPPRSNPLIINTLWLRVATSDPEVENKMVFFAGAGGSVAISTPREGHKVAPMMAVGMRRWFERQVGVELSLQCTVLQVGRTSCVLPLTSLWPFG